MADPYIKIRGSVTDDHPDGTYKMSECVMDPCALSHLSDSILCVIEMSCDPNLKEAQELLTKIKKRELVSDATPDNRKLVIV